MTSRHHRITINLSSTEYFAISSAAGELSVAEWMRRALCRAANVKPDPVRRGFAADRTRAKKASAEGVKARKRLASRSAKAQDVGQEAANGD